MLRCTLLISNNPAFSAVGRPALDVCPVQGSAHDVLCAARNKVHLGWVLLNHPLYGNFRPNHQPFRSLLLSPPPQAGSSVDTFSLNLVEQALAVYDSCPHLWATPDNVPPEMFQDCSLIDVELMQATLVTVP